jgi:DNA-binding CsgD family transcriptional regulator
VPDGLDGQQQPRRDWFLEREEALSALSRVAESARAAQARVLFVEGGAGLGKTEVLHRAASEGPWTSAGWSVGSPMESGLAFSYLGQALEAVGFTDLVTRAPDSSGADLRVRLFMAVRDWLIEQAAHGPILLALDDLHWADQESLALLSFLGRRLAKAAVAIVATLRPWPDGAATLARDLAGAGKAEILSLAPLSDGAARALYLAKAPHGRDPAQTDAVVRLASGNPMLVVEAAQAPGALATVEEQTTPQVVDAMRRALLLSSFAALTKDARSCVQAGAVLGSPFRLGLVEEVSGLGHDAADAGTEALFAAGLLQTAGPGRAAFRHDLVAEAVYDDLDEPRRRRLHERAWQALAKRGDLALATAHALPADLVGLPEAVQVAHQAGNEALSSGAVSSAIHLLKLAEALGGPTTDAAVLVDLGEALINCGHPEEALPAAERALSVKDAGVATRFRALDLMERAALLCGNQPRALAATQAGLKLAADEDDAEAFAEFAVGDVDRILAFSGLLPAFARLEDLHRQAVGLGAGSSADMQTVRAWIAIQAGLSYDMGPLQKAVAAPAETLKPEDPSASWWRIACFVLASGWVEDFQAGERYYRSLAERAAHKRHWRETWSGSGEAAVSDTAMAFACSEWLIRQGRLSDAHAVVAGTDPVGGGISFGAGIELHSLAVLALEAGRTEEAVALISSYQAVADTSGQWHLSCWGAHTKGRVLLVMGRAEEAADTYRGLAAKASAVGLGHPCVVPWAGPALAAFHRSGAQDEVAALVEWLDDASVGSPCRWPRAMAALGRGFLAEDAADHAAADQAFENALGLLRSVRLPLELGEVALAYSAALRRRGERKRAREAVAEAAELAATCGSVLLAEQARSEQARLGARRSRGRPEGLTEAEARVAVLAARGASNSEIAGSLVVSVRTVETHLSSVYAKLGLQSRRQLMVRFPDGTGLTAGSAAAANPG